MTKGNQLEVSESFLPNIFRPVTAVRAEQRPGRRGRCQSDVSHCWDRTLHTTQSHSHTVSRHEIEHVRMDTAHLLLALTVLAAVQTCLGFCPRECVCDDYSLEAACIKSNLEVNIVTLDMMKYLFPIRDSNSLCSPEIRYLSTLQMDQTDFESDLEIHLIIRIFDNIHCRSCR